MKFKITNIFCIILFAIILTSCTNQNPCVSPLKDVNGNCCMDENNDLTCDEEIKEEVITEENIQEEIIEMPIEEPVFEEKEPTPVKSNELPDREFSIEDLSAEISRISGRTEKLQENKRLQPYTEEMLTKGHRFYTNNNEYNTWVVEVIEKEDEELQTMNDFVNYIDASQWRGWRYYVNETWWKYPHKPLSEKELKEILPYYDYKTQYRTELESNWIDSDVKQKVISLNDGRIIPNFEIISIMVTPEQELGYWVGNWDQFILLYKIPCTKDLIIYYRPRYDQSANTAFWNQKKEGVIKYWDKENIDDEKIASQYASSLMDFCKVDSDIFNGIELEDYYNNQRLVNNFKVFYATMYNYSISAEAKTKKVNDEIEIENINITFTSYANEPYLSLLRVKIEIDNQGRVDEYTDTGITSSKPKLNQVYSYLISKDFKRLKGNFTIIVRPYYGYEENTEAEKYYLKTERIEVIV